MEPPDPPAATSQPVPARHLVLPPLLEAIDAWQAEPTAQRQEDVAHALEGVGRLMGLAVGRVRVHAPPLAELDIDLGGGTNGAEIALRVPGVAEPIGSARISGDPEQATAMAHALERGFLAARVRAEAERATNQLDGARPGGPRHQRRAGHRSRPAADHRPRARPRPGAVRGNRHRRRDRRHRALHHQRHQRRGSGPDRRPAPRARAARAHHPREPRLPDPRHRQPLRAVRVPAEPPRDALVPWPADHHRRGNGRAALPHEQAGSGRVQRGRRGHGRDVRPPRRDRDRERPTPRPGWPAGDR